MSNVNIFEQASRNKLRFPTQAGMLSVEDLWDIPLEVSGRSDRLSLDNVAKAVSREIKNLAEESFVKQNRKSPTSELRMAIIKHVIEVRLQDAKDAEERQVKAHKKAMLIEALGQKKVDEIASKSVGELEKELAKL